jgi:hypothetical protein
MFGHQNDQQDQQQVDSQAMDQDVNSLIANDTTTAPMTQTFSPPAPDPGTSFPPAADTIMPSPSEPLVVSPPSADTISPTTPSLDANGLLDIKQQALTQLSPLVGHLEQTPEEKFRTTMMMIQASDNQALIQDAYAAAQQIPEEKIRAQALLDVINEINYFTQHNKS